MQEQLLIIDDLFILWTLAAQFPNSLYAFWTLFLY